MTQSAAPALARPRDVAGLVRRLTLEQKVRLLTGRTAWRLHELPEIGLRSIAMSDGPVGVRGLGEIPGETSALFPSPSAISATWDAGTAFEIGQAFAREARTHGVDVVLAPQVNIQRTPVGGRHFECYSEDPLLTSVIGTQVVRGIQGLGVAACVKHYIANDSETDRTEYVSTVDEQTMREVYLAPFADAVAAGVWSVMAAYNRVDQFGELSPMTDHNALLTGLLKGELGFDGVVVSDWMATRSTAGSALGGLDVVMPGPGGPWEQALLDAVADGTVPVDVIDDKVTRILRLAERVGAFDPEPERPAADEPALADLIRRVSARSTVVLARDDASPVWDRPAPRRIALIGPNAVRPHVLGGGSSTVHTAHVASPAEGLAARFPDAELTVRRGGDSRRFAPDLDLSRLSTMADGVAVEVSLRDAGGALLENRRLVTWDGWLRDLGDDVATVEVRAEVRLEEPGVHRLEVASVGGFRVTVDGVPVHEQAVTAGVEVILDSSINNPDGYGADVEITVPRTVVVESSHTVIRAGGYGAIVRAGLRHRPPGTDAETEIADAAAAAAVADLTVVIVGTNEEVESEGWDRSDLRLPGRQDDLVEKVLDADPDAVIVVNAGAPVILPWLARARTVLWVWFPGQEMGHALAAVLAGDLEPSGRLPWTLPASEGDVPVPDAIPGTDRRVRYAEGVHVGYRGWDRLGRTPAAAFGAGLGWGAWHYESLAATEWTPQGDLLVTVELRNTGTRTSREVVQVYLEPPAGAAIERPARWLAGFTGAEVAPGESSRVIVAVPRRSFEAWDTEQNRWTVLPGPYRVAVGRSARDIRLDSAVRPEFPDAH